MTVDADAERAASPLRFLHHLDPLSKVAATLPAMAVVLLSRDVVTPLLALAAAVVLLVVGYVVPLLVGALRHASRVALAMDARAFGAMARRTQRHRLRWRVRDTVVVTIGFALTAWLAVHAFV